MLSRFTHCNKFNIWWPVQDPHLRHHWWTCHHCHLEEKWGSDNSQCYPPANQEYSWSCWRYLPDSAHHWSISVSEWCCGDIQLHSGKCHRTKFTYSGCSRWDLKLCTLPYIINILFSMFTCTCIYMKPLAVFASICRLKWQYCGMSAIIKFTYFTFLDW